MSEYSLFLQLSNTLKNKKAWKKEKLILLYPAMEK